MRRPGFTVVRIARGHRRHLRHLAADVVDWLRMRAHQPVRVEGRDWCTGHCDPTPWPCRPHVEAASRRAARRMTQP